jgi:hypothetical protein
MTKWIKYRRKRGKSLDPVARITIRTNQIAFNAHFVAIAHLEEKPYVSAYVNPDLFRLGFQFDAKSTNEDAIALRNDGGPRGKGCKGRCMGAVGLMREYPWLKAMGKIKNPRLRRIEPQWSGTDGMWVISLCPCFERRVSDRSDISHESGIYRYKRGDVIVYVGRGQIRSRLGSSEREEWDFETIEYSVVPDNDQQVKWEAWWLDRFVEEHGKLPLYNRISAKRPTKHGDG